MLNGIAGAASSASFVSCISRTSGFFSASHSSTRSRRALSELTFHVAMRIRASELPPAGRRLVAAALLSGEVEFGRVGDTHHGHRAGLDRIRDHEIGDVRDRADHIESDDRDTELLDLDDGPGDVAA